MAFREFLAAFLPNKKSEPGSEPASDPNIEEGPTFQERAVEQRRILTEALQQHVSAFYAFRYHVEQGAPHQSWGYTDRFKQIVSEQSIIKDTPQARIGMVIALTYWLTEKTESLENVKLIDDWRGCQATRHLLTRLLNYKLPYTAADLTLVMNLLARRKDDHPRRFLNCYPVSTLLSRVEDIVETSGLTADMERALRRFRELFTRKNDEVRRILLRIGTLLGETALLELETGISWIQNLKKDILSIEGEQRQAWEILVSHSLGPRSSKPSQKWLDKASELIDCIGRDVYKTQLLQWISRVSSRSGSAIPDNAGGVLRGFVWACLLIDDTELARAIGNLALICFEKPRSLSVGYACLYTLSWMASDYAVGELCRIRPRVKIADLRRKVTLAMNEAASRRNLSVTDLEEIAVPTFGLETDMYYPIQPGGYRAKFAYRPGGRIRVDWFDADGKLLKSTPSPVRRKHAETLKEIRRAQKTANALLSTQRSRMERLFIHERSWSMQDWRTRYLDQPFVGLLARLLIWRFEQDGQRVDAIWIKDQIIDLNGQPVECLTEDTRVSLWHPLDCEAETVLAWRVFLEENQITQPFKQAHREIYLITDAELETNTYSNRFAAHILRHVPFFGVVRTRGWKYSTASGDWNHHSAPTLELPYANLKVEYWVDPIRDPQFGEGLDKSISTDQVRFVDDEGQAVPLSQVPPRIFSESMRDVDLFVGVTSIGADPNWQNQRDRTQEMQTYWQGYSFGDLSTSAQGRREVLERLLPRLKIAACSQLTDKFLVVKGHVKTYKIHLGSGNILMEPNDQYLCIVPDRSNLTRSLFLPFEGDQTLAVILSKAFLLAEDRQIKDSTITRQINHCNENE